MHHSTPLKRCVQRNINATYDNMELSGTSHRRLFCFIFCAISMPYKMFTIRCCFFSSFFLQPHTKRKEFFFWGCSIAYARRNNDESMNTMKFNARNLFSENTRKMLLLLDLVVGTWLEAFTGSNICVQNFRRYRVSVFSVTMVLNMYFSGI